MGTIAEVWIEKGAQQGLETGRRQELLAGIELALELRYGTTGLVLMPEISAVNDLNTLTAIRDGIRTVPTPADLQQIYR